MTPSRLLYALAGACFAFASFGASDMLARGALVGVGYCVRAIVTKEATK